MDTKLSVTISLKILLLLFQCLPGYGGKRCSLDSDNDGWPDTAQSCSDAGCAQVNCVP